MYWSRRVPLTLDGNAPPDTKDETRMPPSKKLVCEGVEEGRMWDKRGGDGGGGGGGNGDCGGDGDSGGCDGDNGDSGGDDGGGNGGGDDGGGDEI